MKKDKNRLLWATVTGAVITVFTLYVALDTFVIPKAYVTVASVFSGSSSALNYGSDNEGSSVVSDVTYSSDPDDETASETTDAQAAAEPVITETSYSDNEKSIELTTYEEYETTIYVADVKTSSVTDLLSAFAQDTYGRNITAATSSIAESNNAVLAINGDFYGSQESGYVIRNGILYRDSAQSGQEDLVIYSDGTWDIINEDNITAQELMEAGAWQVLSFGPAIVNEGQIAVTEDEEVDRAKTSNPRTAIGFIDDNHYVLIVSDGRTEESEGLTLYQLAEFMQSLGVKTAYNLDGGGSSTMYFNGEVVNNPTSSGRSIKERAVSDIIYF